MSCHDSHSLGNRSLKSPHALAQPFVKEDTKGIREEDDASPLQEKGEVEGSEQLSLAEQTPKARMAVGAPVELGARESQQLPHCVIMHTDPACTVHLPIYSCPF